MNKMLMKEQVLFPTERSLGRATVSVRSSGVRSPGFSRWSGGFSGGQFIFPRVVSRDGSTG